MTSWPWMKDIDVALADPIDPVNEYDKRPSVKELIIKHRVAIDNLRKEVEPDELFDPTKHDDLWLLRFVLSHKVKANSKKKKMDGAIKAVKYTLEFRKKHNLDAKDIRCFLPNNDQHMYPECAKYLKFCGEDFLRYAIPDPKLGVISYFWVGARDERALVANLSEEEWVAAFVSMNEWTHQWLDYITRTTGRLTKTVRFADLEGSSLAKVDLTCGKMDGKATSAMEDCYPQLLHGIYLVHAPSWVQVPWKVLRVFMPKRTVEKFDFISPKTNRKELERLKAFIDLKDLPDRYGGMNHEWPIKDISTPLKTPQ